MTANTLGLLGLARKAGKLELGEEPVSAACRGRRAQLVLLASDAAENTARRAGHLAQTAKVPCMQVPLSKAELGAAMGRASCAVLTLTDGGFAKALLKKLREETL